MDIKIAVHFDEIGWELRKLLGNAKYSIKICVAWIGWRLYKDLLFEASQRGVSVDAIFNADEKNAFARDSLLSSIRFYPIKMQSARRYMHNKFCIIDDEILITGSFNWSRSAEAHFENIIVLKHAYKAIKEYLHEFNDLIDYYHEWVHFPRYEPCLVRTPGYNLQCRSRSYYIGLFGQESGLYNESETEIWRICNAEQRHAEFITSSYENF